MQQMTPSQQPEKRAIPMPPENPEHTDTPASPTQANPRKPSTAAKSVDDTPAPKYERFNKAMDEKEEEEEEERSISPETMQTIVFFMILAVCGGIVMIPFFGLYYMIGMLSCVTFVLYGVINHYERGAFYRFPDKPEKKKTKKSKAAKAAKAPKPKSSAKAKGGKMDSLAGEMEQAAEKAASGKAE